MTLTFLFCSPLMTHTFLFCSPLMTPTFLFCSPLMTPTFLFCSPLMTLTFLFCSLLLASTPLALACSLVTVPAKTASRCSSSLATPPVRNSTCNECSDIAHVCCVIVAHNPWNMSTLHIVLVLAQWNYF